MSTVWLSAQARRRLEDELAALVTHRDADADAEDYDGQVVDAWLSRKTRIRQIHELLSSAGPADLPPDDGVAEPGMVLTVRFDDGDTETFLLGVRGAEQADVEVYSPDSPLGRAVLGATPGARREYPRPDGTRQGVTLLAAQPLS